MINSAPLYTYPTRDGSRLADAARGQDRLTELPRAVKVDIRDAERLAQQCQQFAIRADSRLR